MSDGRHKFFVDENIPPACADIFRKPFKRALFRSCADEELLGMKDVALFRTLSDRGFSVIITHDKNQLFHADELNGLRDARLHWVGIDKIKGSGASYYSQLIAALSLAIPRIIAGDISDPHRFMVSSDPARMERQLSIERL